MKKKTINNEIDIIDILNILIKFKKIIIINITLCLLVFLLIFFTTENYKKKFRITLSLNEPIEYLFKKYYYYDLYAKQSIIESDDQYLPPLKNYKDIFWNIFNDNLLSKKNFDTFLLSYEFDNKSKILEFNIDRISNIKNIYYIDYSDKSLDLSKLILDYVLFSKNKSTQEIKIIINNDLSYEIYKVRVSMEIARDINIKYPFNVDQSHENTYISKNKHLELFYSGEILLKSKLNQLEKILTNLSNENFDYNLINTDPTYSISSNKNKLLIHLFLVLLFGIVLSTMQILITQSSKKKIKKS